MEKYGTVPKKFTKEWWEYFWDYYKWHVIIGAVLLAMITVTAVQLVTKIKYDAVVTYIGTAVYSEDAQKEIADSFAQITDDVNGNGKKDVQFQIISTASSKSALENPQYTMAIETKTIFEIQTGESFLFIMDAEQVQKIYENGIADGLFIPVEDWLEEINSEVEPADGAAGDYFVKLPTNAFFKNYEFECGDIYVGVRKIRENEDEISAKEQIAAFKLANYLLSYR